MYNIMHIGSLVRYNYYIIDYEIDKSACVLRNTHIAIIVPSGAQLAYLR